MEEGGRACVVPGIFLAMLAQGQMEACRAPVAPSVRCLWLEEGTCLCGHQPWASLPIPAPPPPASDQSWAGVWASSSLWASVSQSPSQEVGQLVMMLEIWGWGWRRGAHPVLLCGTPAPIPCTFHMHWPAVPWARAPRSEGQGLPCAQGFRARECPCEPSKHRARPPLAPPCP